ncbi:MAG: peptidoglycan-binding protein [Mycobacterium sp.]
MGFRTVYGHAVSEAGWRMCNRDECVRVPGPFMDTAPLRKGPPAIILGDFARRYHVECAPIISPVWGWSATNDASNSNHLSGTALDINAPQWPWGYKTMGPVLVGKIRRLLTDYEGAVFWGRAWSKPDEMHVQMGWPEGDGRYARIIDKIHAAPETPSTEGDDLSIGSEGQKVRQLQAGLNRVFPSYSQLDVDGIYGPLTESVVREFQTRSGIAADGIVGPVTGRALSRFGITLTPEELEVPAWPQTDRELLEYIAEKVTR